MIYVIQARDNPGQLERRMEIRPEHLAYLDKVNAEGKLVFAGPFLDDEGKPCGSMVAYEAESREEAEKLANGDPYAQAGLFESVEIRPWNWVYNKPEKA